MLPDVPQVRGHHLLCLMTYVGMGYTSKFVQAMDALVAHLNAGGAVALCAGPDMLCTTLQSEASPCAAYCTLARNVARDLTAMQQLFALTGLAISVGTQTDTTRLDVSKIRDALQRLDAAASLEGLRRTCGGCEWLQMCRRISRRDYSRTKLRPAAN